MRTLKNGQRLREHVGEAELGLEWVGVVSMYKRACVHEQVLGEHVGGAAWGLEWVSIVSMHKCACVREQVLGEHVGGAARDKHTWTAATPRPA